MVGTQSRVLALAAGTARTASRRGSDLRVPEDPPSVRELARHQPGLSRLSLFPSTGLLVSKLSFESSFFILDSGPFHQIYTRQISSAVHGLSSHSKSIFGGTKVSNFDEAQFINFFFFVHCDFGIVS